MRLVCAPIGRHCSASPNTDLLCQCIIARTCGAIRQPRVPSPSSYDPLKIIDRSAPGPKACDEYDRLPSQEVCEGILRCAGITVLHIPDELVPSDAHRMPGHGTSKASAQQVWRALLLGRPLMRQMDCGGEDGCMQGSKAMHCMRASRAVTDDKAMSVIAGRHSQHRAAAGARGGAPEPAGGAGELCAARAVREVQQ